MLLYTNTILGSYLQFSGSQCLPKLKKKFVTHATHGVLLSISVISPIQSW